MACVVDWAVDDDHDDWSVVGQAVDIAAVGGKGANCSSFLDLKNRTGLGES